MHRTSKRRPSQKRESGGKTADPNAGSRGLGEVQGAVGGTERERFIVFAAGDGELRAGMEMQVVEELQEFSVLSYTQTIAARSLACRSESSTAPCLRSCVTPPLSGRPWGQDSLSANRLRRSASISGEMACSRRSASSWALDQEMPMTSVSNISAS